MAGSAEDVPASEERNVLRTRVSVSRRDRSRARKNLALVYRPAGLELAPLYDLVSTAVYEGLERRLAMKIGAAVDVRNVQRSDWERFAGSGGLGLLVRQVREWLLDQAERVRRAVAAARRECRTQIGPSPVYESIGRMVERQAGRLERELAGTAK